MTSPVKRSKRAPSTPIPHVREESSVERLYLELRDRAMRYDIRPGARVNEKLLGEELRASRATLREALNRLVAEGFFDFVMNKGFFRKAVSVDEVFDLYQVRIALERRAVFLSIERASEEDISALREFWNGIMRRAAALSSADLLLADEEFHRRLVALSRNKELSAFLEIVTRRIHVARHIDIELHSEWNQRAFDGHAVLVDLIAQRDNEQALRALTEHIDMSLKRAVAITKEMVARFFLVESTSPGDSSFESGSEPHGKVRSHAEAAL